jgi:periplasmic protein TonB
MAYKVSQGSGPRWAIGIVIVVLLHIGFFIGLQLGLVQKALKEVETVASAVKEPPPPPPQETPPPPPPPVTEPPPYVPPPDIVVAQTTTATNAIQQVTTTRPPPDRPAQVLAESKPDYPPTSLENCEQGTVTLSVSIDERGRAVDVAIVKSSGYPELDNSAISWMKRQRFAAARKDGRPYATQQSFNVEFKMTYSDPDTKRAYEECVRMNKISK